MKQLHTQSVSALTKSERGSDSPCSAQVSSPDEKRCSHVVLDLKRQGQKNLYSDHARITVGMSTCGIGAGAGEVYDALGHSCHTLGLEHDVLLVAVGCLGMCWAEPLVSIQIARGPRAYYAQVDPSSAEEIVKAASIGELPSGLTDQLLGYQIADSYYLAGTQHVFCEQSGVSLKPLLYDLPYLAAQSRAVLSDCGHIDPTSLAEYCAVGGYQAFLSVIAEGQPDTVIETVLHSGLRGRGGAGFVTGEKWQLVAESAITDRYLVVNADEGDPGAYMDRMLLESDPFRVIEGISIAAWAMGCKKAYIFIRSEYALALEILQTALDVAHRLGFLGKDIHGSGFDLTVDIVTSAGAFICGEETAMIAAMEGYLCEPYTRPPYPSEQGLFGLPTCINNVETLANIPGIISRGAEHFCSVGTQESPGTKLFTLVGALQHVGVIEIALGTHVETIINTIGNADSVRALQIGGPSGSLISYERAVAAQLRVDYEALSAFGGTMGSGGMVALGEEQCVVDTVLYCLAFAADESCGKCAPCRDGLLACKIIVERMVSGSGAENSLSDLEELCHYIEDASLCSFGRMVPNLVIRALTNFREEFEAHLNGRCNALVCRELIRFEIDQSTCQGERCCLQTCPGNAIKGPFGKPGHIVSRLCTKCWMCTVHCPYGAVRVVTGRT